MDAGQQAASRPPDLVEQDTAPPDAALPESAPPGTGQSDGRHCQVTLCPALESAKLARDFTRDTLRGWQLDSVVHEAVIIASELVTNAIRHGVSLAAGNPGQTGVELTWQRHASRLICVVTDQSAKPPVLASAGPDAESGRGLQVVQALAAGWGWMMLGAQEKVVWAALLLPSGG
jgi:two-component sensor histidine kinase